MERLEEIWLNYRKQIIIAVVALVGILIVGGKLCQPQSNKIEDPFTTTNKKSLSTQRELPVRGKKDACVDIKGAVTHPGVYRLAGGSRVNEALSAAGRETPDADMNQVNLAKQLVDAQVIYIPRKGEQVPTTLAGGMGTASTVNNDMNSGSQEITNLNTATKEQLCKITGIGNKKADLILQYRQEHGNFNSVDDLKNINGFGEKTVAKLKPMLAV
ncbi:helix-hairpin-helix domain-containing protein [Limosilactobacillus fastidiosus]|uniref:Helix-hairpin-helix domain-containing protein n=1 Tax=Limosilactobacillus fastidiosus TaxID=2759855 RepID=A0ABR6E553_9LACO|nr:helix-hairpin-helix domain-containing protein [Limosilactobacillus fastidiosus]MBB1062321.1 helix-hairpin-helix domain-containing protein [Limosilactobacillus fastidiosus]MCD7083398.1 helix-hairpin-helix domain-containing protein [Limosilactobacillus fastidiosus]